MCFSPEASFTGAAVLCAFGIATINLAKSHKHLLLLACMPFLFAIQQAGEGFVWLALQGVLTSPDALKLGKDVFILFAYGIWPIFVPIAIYFAETSELRKRLLLYITFLGIAVVATIFYNISLSEIAPKIHNNSIQYINEPSLLYKCGYLIAVTLPFILSSLRYAWIFGILIAIAFFTTNYIYFTTFTSIWCFFGAILSIALYWIVKIAVNQKA